MFIVAFTICFPFAKYIVHVLCSQITTMDSALYMLHPIVVHSKLMFVLFLAMYQCTIVEYIKVHEDGSIVSIVFIVFSVHNRMS